MGNGKRALLEKRLREYPDQGLLSKNEELFCTMCSVTVDFSKSSTVKNHMISQLHIRNKSTGQLQPQIASVVASQVEKRSLWSGMASTFVSAGIPLHVFRNSKIRKWFSANIKHGVTMPSESTLRVYLTKEGEVDLKETKALCDNKDIIIIVDETQDIKNRKIANLLVAPAEPNNKIRLLHTEILDKCDSSTISQFIIDGLSAAEIKIKNVIALISDNARYMLAAGKTYQLLNPRSIHSTCWAHILHLAAEDVRASLELADELIAKIKACLVKAPSRRAELLNTLERHGKEKKLPPTPEITRWCTWLSTGEFHWKNFHAIKDWIAVSEADSLAMKKLKDLIVNPDLLAELECISLIHSNMASTLKTLEGNNVPASDVMQMLETIRGTLKLNPSLEPGLVKLNDYLSKKHPCVSFWRDVQYFDPRKMYLFKNVNELPVSLKKFAVTPVPSKETIAYQNICNNFTAGPDFSPNQFWTNQARELPEMSRLALKLLSIPPTSAEVERSFSYLNRLMIPIRSSLTPENLAVHMRTQFNNREVGLLNSEEDEGDFEANDL